MKKIIFFILFLIFAIFIFNKFYITGFAMLKMGEDVEVDGKIVTIKQISADTIIIDVSGVSNIIRLNSYKDINGVRISVNEIFFVDEREGRHTKLSLESLYTCGDQNCEGDETKESCCKDCGCNPGYICENDKCIIESKSSKYDECRDNEDCEDNNEFTVDKCEGMPKKCVHVTYYQCETNEDCDDKNKCTKDECRNYECFNTKISGCKSEVKIEEPSREIQKEIGGEEEEEKQKSFLSRLFSKLFWWLK